MAYPQEGIELVGGPHDGDRHVVPQGVWEYWFDGVAYDSRAYIPCADDTPQLVEYPRWRDVYRRTPGTSYFHYAGRQDR